MYLKEKVDPEVRVRILAALGPFASMALVLSIVLERVGQPELDFLSGLLIGLSIVGNLGYIYVVGRHLRNR